MRLRIAAILIALSYTGAAAPPADAIFGQGMKAVEDKDWDAALSLLEQALLEDANNVRYGSEYRQAVLSRAKALHPKEGKPQDFERALTFFDKLVKDNPGAENAYLNYGFTYVDKIPAAGSITQVILANTALTQFTKSVELKPTWIGYYTRGASYLFWPSIFGRAKLGIADLEEAMKMVKDEPGKPLYARVWVSLGDGYWKIDDLEKARAVWSDGLKRFPGNPLLTSRLSKQGDDLKSLIEDALDPNKRVDTNLKDLWTN
jgi:tetratricopeptide (TPR) repeat protein